MEPIYSKTQFEGYTHRFIVQFETQDMFSTLQIYSNSNSFKDLETFINDKKTDKVISFKIEHRASKEQDEAVTKFIDGLD